KAGCSARSRACLPGYMPSLPPAARRFRGRPRMAAGTAREPDASRRRATAAAPAERHARLADRRRPPLPPPRGRAIAVRADGTDRAAVQHAVAEAEARLGPVDFLVNNAGSAAVIGPMWETDPDDWWREVEVNLRGPLLCAHAVLPGMIARRRGRIVNMASGVGLTPFPYTSAYACSKMALVRLTDSLQEATSQHGVTVL